MIKNILSSFKIIIFAMIIIAVIYQLLLYVFGVMFFQDKVSGSLIFDKNAQIRGSTLIAQHNNNIDYFLTRPNCLLKKAFKENKYDLLNSCSASNLDPYITEQDAFEQVNNINFYHKIPKERILKIIQNSTVKYLPLFYQTNLVNTTQANLELQKLATNSFD